MPPEKAAFCAGSAGGKGAGAAEISMRLQLLSLTFVQLYAIISVSNRSLFKQQGE